LPFTGHGDRTENRSAATVFGFFAVHPQRITVSMIVLP
jgi:hypothetical protein